MKYVLPIAAGILALTSLSTNVQADDLDQWCAEVTKASSRVICSDPELRRLTILRGNMLLEYKQYLTPDQQKEVDQNQTVWVLSYTANCGVPRDGIVPAAISPLVVTCFRGASYARNAAIQQAINKISATVAVPPAAAPPTEPLRLPEVRTYTLDLPRMAPVPMSSPPAAPALPPMTSTSATGLSFTVRPIAEHMIIIMSGNIEKGDFQRFGNYIGRLAENPATKDGRFVGIALNSLGGAVSEAILFAKFIQQGNFMTLVADNNRCASACVLMFAAGTKRIAARDVYIGVHSASDQFDEETPGATAATVVMARMLGQFNVPSAIIGRMVQTGPNSMYRLTETDLRSWDVDIVQ